MPEKNLEQITDPALLCLLRQGMMQRHQSAVISDGQSTLGEGTKVTYVAEAGDKGPRAGNVRIA